MRELLEIIKGKKAGNIYQLNYDISQENLKKMCQENNCYLFYLNGTSINNKKDFFQGCISSFDFPEYFGNNWDAWEECLTDLSWCKASAYVFYFQNYCNFAHNDSQNWAILLEILEETIAYWQGKNINFSVILREEIK